MPGDMFHQLNDHILLQALIRGAKKAGANLEELWMGDMQWHVLLTPLSDLLSSSVENLTKLHLAITLTEEDADDENQSDMYDDWITYREQRHLA